MDVRSLRLQADGRRLQELGQRSTLISVQPQNALGDRYRVTYSCRGLVWLPGAPGPAVTSHHEMEIYLHLDYPRLPPRIQWLTEIFHPNILPPRRNGGVCIGRWSPAETLDQLVIRIGEMVQYKNFSTSDALDTNAAAWVAAHRSAFPVDPAPILDVRSDISISLGDSR
ncbi:MAG TPA: ubiquitin-conjugating enzyme E2 [Armatimonadota bacterium]|jgi:ubiquitin-protein ligase